MKHTALLLLAALGLHSGLALHSRSLPATAAAPAVVGLRVDLDRPVVPAARGETVVVRVCLDGVRDAQATRAPINLALVIDKSGSMAGMKLIRAREAALEAVSRLSRDDMVSLVAYDGGVRVLWPASPVGDGEALRTAIMSLSASGGTNLHGGVEAGAAELRKHIEGAFIHRVILLSDGQANVGPQTPEALGSLGARLLREGVSVTTIGLGEDFNEDLMTRLARRSDGNTYYVARADDLPRVFGDELGDVLDVVARRALLTLEFAPGARPLRLVGREGRVGNGQVRVELNQLYGGQSKYVLVEVALDAGVDGARREVVRASVDYQDARNGRAGGAMAWAEVRFAPPEAVIASANHGVQADYAAHLLAEAKEEAVALVDVGRRADAAARLRDVAAGLQDEARLYGNSVVSGLAAAVPASAAVIEREGISNSERKSLRSEAHQTYNQQYSR